MLDEQYGRHPLAKSRPPFTCGISGAEYSALEVRDRVDRLARALSCELGWHPNEGTEWDKVIGVFSVNTVRVDDATGTTSKTELMRMRGSRLIPSRYHGRFTRCPGFHLP